MKQRPNLRYSQKNDDDDFWNWTLIDILEEPCYGAWHDWIDKMRTKLKRIEF